jgi:L-threonylcarbamoyladenylate synthase
VIRLRVHAVDPDPALVSRAAASIAAGGIVALPTDTLYGLAADPFNADAVHRLFALKGRATGQALPLIAFDSTQITRQLGPLGHMAQRLADRFWPGPLTLLVSVPRGTPLPGVPRPLAEAVSAGTGRVGVRVPAHAVARALCAAAGTLLTATSANVSGQPPTDDPDAVAAAIGGAIDILLDAGTTPGGPPSTIIDVPDVAGGELRLIRPGALGWDEVRACARGE